MNMGTDAFICRPRPRRRRRALVAVLVIISLLTMLGAGAAVAKTIVCANNTACAGTRRDDTIRGEGQNDLFGKRGKDRITSAGNSVVEGNAGKDRITAFAGGNIIRGGPGDDVINAVNDALDQIDCGPGKDKVLYDGGVDTLQGCEKRLPR